MGRKACLGRAAPGIRGHYQDNIRAGVLQSGMQKWDGEGQKCRLWPRAWRGGSQDITGAGFWLPGMGARLFGRILLYWNKPAGWMHAPGK